MLTLLILVGLGWLVLWATGSDAPPRRRSLDVDPRFAAIERSRAEQVQALKAARRGPWAPVKKNEPEESDARLH